MEGERNKMIANKDIPEGFERLIKGEKLGFLPNRTIAVSNSDRVTFSKDLGKLLFPYFGLEVFINRSKKKILFIPSNDKMTACKLTKPTNNKNNGYTSHSIFSKKFYREGIKEGIYPVRYNFGRVEFDYKLNDKKDAKDENKVIEKTK